MRSTSNDNERLGDTARWLSVAIIVVDLCVLVATSIIAVALRRSIPWFRDPANVEAQVGQVAWLVIGFWMLALAGTGAYRSGQLGESVTEYRSVLNASLLTAAAVGIASYLTKFQLSRGYYFLLFLIGIPLLLIFRVIMRRVLQRMHEHGLFRKSIFIAGDCVHIAEIITALRHAKWRGYRVTGVLTRDGQPCEGFPEIPVVGRPNLVASLLKEHPADGVLFTEGAFEHITDFNGLARKLERVNVDLMVVPRLSDVSANRLHVHPLAGLPIVRVEKTQGFRALRWSKRLFDIVGSSLAIIIASPIMLATAIAIKLDDGGPVFFRQQRVGVHRSTFTCYKFRSMHPDAEKIKAQWLASRNEADGVLFKIKADPRITRVGKFTRRYSIDELPQLFNVFLGDMSLVGPRPALESEVAEYEARVMRRLDVRPGLTGLWQVSGRSDLSWSDSVRLDLYYVDNWSFLQDINILFKTVRAVLASDGAY